MRFPSGSRERPTSDFLRESLFNLLGSLENKSFLDLFAGSGSVGLEAASRDAQEIFFVEKDKRLVEIIKNNIPDCCGHKNYRIVAADVEKALKDLYKKECRFDIVFADPPYNRNLVNKTLELLKKYPIFKEEHLIVIQHSVKENLLDALVDNIRLKDQRKYGENVLTFLKMEN